MLFVKYFLRLLYTCCHKAVPVWVVLFLLTFLQSVVLLFSLGKWMRIEYCMHWYLWISGLILILVSFFFFFLLNCMTEMYKTLRYPVFFTFLDRSHVVLTEEARLICKKSMKCSDAVNQVAWMKAPALSLAVSFSSFLYSKSFTFFTILNYWGKTPQM